MKDMDSLEAHMKSASSQCGRHSQVGVGVLVIAVGVLFLLHNLGILHFGYALSFWPTLLIVFGLVKLAEARTPGGRAVGAALVATGVILMLSRLGLIELGWRIIWPLAIIGLGGVLVFRALSIRSGQLPALKDGMDAGHDVLDATAILGGFERRLTTAQFGGGDITAIMGGCSIDLRACSLQGEAVINVFAVMGGITLKCPPDWTVVLNGIPIMGGFEEKTVRPPDGSKRLVVKGYAIMGGVDVRN
jgi:predicted membrane protein